MSKRILICAVLGGMVSVATSAHAATPAAPIPMTIASPTTAANVSPLIEQVQWRRGRWRWNGRYWGHRRWRGGRWWYW